MRSILLVLRKMLLVLARWLYRFTRFLLELIGLDKHPVLSTNVLVCSSVWTRLFHVWELHGRDYLAKAPERDCPLCHSTSRQPLWPTEDGYTYVFCTECKMVYSTPALTHAMWKQYFDEFQYELAPINRSLAEAKLSEVALIEDRERFSRYLTLIAKHSESKLLLDIGCFTGNFLALARGQGYQVAGVEFYEDAVREGGAFYGLNIQRGFFEEIAPTMIQSSTRFDVITLWETLEHMSNPDQVLHYCHDLLSPGGIIALTVPNFDCLHVRLLREKCHHALGGPGNPGHMNMFTESTLIDIAIRNGFKAVHLSTEAGTDYADVLNYLSLDFHRINSYSNALQTSQSNDQPVRPFLPNSISNAIVRLSPLWRLIENSCNRGAILLLVARKR